MEKSLHAVRCGVHFFGTEPEVRVSLVNAQDRIREGQCAVGHQAADVVCVHVGNVDLIDLLWLIAGGFQIGQQVAQCGAE